MYAPASRARTCSASRWPSWSSKPPDRWNLGARSPTIRYRWSHKDATMTATHKARYCRCGARLARDNTGTRCAPCVAHERDQLYAAPEIPADFWDEVVLSEALQSRHMGRVIRAWRTHPFHGRRPIPQDRVASWVGLTQAQLSRIENGPAIAHLDRLTQWAEVLRIPADR